MKTQILVSLFILSFSQAVFSECDIFDFECYIDELLEDDSSEENPIEGDLVSGNKIVDDLNEVVSTLSSLLNKTEEKLSDIPSIVSYLKNLTSLVTQVQNHLLSQPTANSIQTETNGKKEKEELHNETSTNFDHEHHSSQDRINATKESEIMQNIPNEILQKIAAPETKENQPNGGKEKEENEVLQNKTITDVDNENNTSQDGINATEMSEILQIHPNNMNEIMKKIAQEAKENQSNGTTNQYLKK